MDKFATGIFFEEVSEVIFFRSFPKKSGVVIWRTETVESKRSMIIIEFLNFDKNKPLAVIRKKRGLKAEKPLGEKTGINNPAKDKQNMGKK